MLDGTLVKKMYMECLQSSRRREGSIYSPEAFATPSPCSSQDQCSALAFQVLSITYRTLVHDSHVPAMALESG